MGIIKRGKSTSSTRLPRGRKSKQFRERIHRIGGGLFCGGFVWCNPLRKESTIEKRLLDDG